MELYEIRTEAERASLFEALAFPTLGHAHDDLWRARNAILRDRTELHRFLTTPTSDNPLDRMIQKPGWQWRAARDVCRHLRKMRVWQRKAEARVVRMRIEAAEREIAARHARPLPALMEMIGRAA